MVLICEAVIFNVAKFTTSGIAEYGVVFEIPRTPLDQIIIRAVTFYNSNRILNQTLSFYHIFTSEFKNHLPRQVIFIEARFDYFLFICGNRLRNFGIHIV